MKVKTGKDYRQEAFLSEEETALGQAGGLLVEEPRCPLQTGGPEAAGNGVCAWTQMQSAGFVGCRPVPASLPYGLRGFVST